MGGYFWRRTDKSMDFMHNASPKKAGKPQGLYESEPSIRENTVVSESMYSDSQLDAFLSKYYQVVDMDQAS